MEKDEPIFRCVCVFFGSSQKLNCFQITTGNGLGMKEKYLFTTVLKRTYVQSFVQQLSTIVRPPTKQSFAPIFFQYLAPFLHPLLLFSQSSKTFDNLQQQQQHLWPWPNDINTPLYTFICQRQSIVFHHHHHFTSISFPFGDFKNDRGRAN